MTPRRQLDTFLDRYTSEVSGLAREAFAWMRRRFPGAAVLVYDNYNALAIGFGPSEKTSEAVFSIALYPRWVSLFFLYGATLPDPHHVLKGSGNQARHIVLQSTAMLDEPPVEALIAEAARGGGLAAGGAARGKIVIKSVSARQRPRRPAAVKRARA